MSFTQLHVIPNLGPRHALII